MSDPRTNSDFQDVLSSIRRLISEDLRAEPRPSGKLVLTAAHRIEAADPAPARAEEGMPDIRAEVLTLAVGADTVDEASATLEDTIAELEAAVARIGDEFEPDGGEEALARRQGDPALDGAFGALNGAFGEGFAVDVAADEAGGDAGGDVGAATAGGDDGAPLDMPITADRHRPDSDDGAAVAGVVPGGSEAQAETAEGPEGAAAEAPGGGAFSGAEEWPDRLQGWPQDGASAETVDDHRAAPIETAAEPEPWHDDSGQDAAPTEAEAGRGAAEPDPESAAVDSDPRAEQAAAGTAAGDGALLATPGRIRRLNLAPSGESGDDPDAAADDGFAASQPDAADADAAWPAFSGATAAPADPPLTFQHAATHPAAGGGTEAEDDEDAGDQGLFADDDESVIDMETLHALVADIIRQELQGPLGERITRNVRKLVRREIHRALDLRIAEAETDGQGDA
ncbi:MAG: hypothetical protein CVT84_08885 [Alphaproteobacteria bacterium HGW-Alphaproteobacteria-6]|nr:MAG: hypothetical protein CVT84_08885 [Alphaproteobacteria bacterium HGW-Alphaproteobacteria-6]